MNLIHIPYAEFVSFFKSHPAIWYTIKQMMKEEDARNR